MLGIIAVITDSTILHLLARLETALAQHLNALGNFQHAPYRAAVKPHQRTAAVKQRFVDGDLVERFLGLARADMERVVARALKSPLTDGGIPPLGRDYSVNEVVHIVEGLAQLH